MCAPQDERMDGQGGFEDSDGDLVRRAQGGERSAFDRLVLKYRKRVLGLAMRYTRERADAEDAVQIAFLKAYSALHQFRQDSSFYTWLHRIVVNAAKNLLDKRSRQRALFSTQDALSAALPRRDPSAREVPTPEELIMSEDICAGVHAALGALREEQREAILMRELGGMAYEEIARVMACPLGTVRSRVFRAREAIDHDL